jgi:hypothetical protein
MRVCHRSRRRRQGTKAPAAALPHAKQFGSQALFFFFSNRLGCLGSLAISAILTLALLMFFGFL